MNILKQKKYVLFAGKKFFESYTKYTLSKFCSRKCSCTYSSKINRKERNKKISNSLTEFFENTPKAKKDSSKKNKEKRYCIICGVELTYEQVQNKNKTCSLKCGSQAANKTKQQNGTVFVENGQGRSRSGYWNNFFCNSTYELVYYIYMTEHGYKVERNKKAYEYEWNGVMRHYYPDFNVNR